MKKLLALLLALTLAGCAARVESPAAPEAEPVPEPPGATEPPAAAEAPSPVYTDWSKLTPYEPAKEIYTYHAGYRADGSFEPRGDYGALLPYVGKYSVMEQYVIDELPLYGLVTDKGELVSGPLYSSVYSYDGFFLLYRGGGDAYSGGRQACTLAASDGRWAHELERGHYIASGFGLLLTAAADDSIDVWNADGEVVTRFDGAVFAPYFGEGSLWDGETGPFIDLADDKVAYAVAYIVNDEYVEDGVRLYLDLASGAVLTEPPEGYPRELDYEALEGDLSAPPEIERNGYLERIVDEVTGETYFCGFCPDGGGLWHETLFDSAGRDLLGGECLWEVEGYVIVRAGLCATEEDGCFCLRSLADNSLVFRYRTRTNSD